MSPDQLLQLQDITALNIEVSSKCIGKCPFCSRQQKVRPYGGHLISFSEFKLLPADFIRQLEWITFAGNFGDFCSNPEFVEIAGYVKKLNPSVKMGGDTNGSLRDASWWKDLGPFFHDGGIVFSLDGLADTHAIHRRGTNFHKIIKNIEAFTAAGGTAYWKFIAFKHNEHQIKAAETLAEDIGCARFFVISSRDYDERCRRPETFDFKIKREIFSAYRQKHPSNEAPVRCKPWHNGSIYIAADGSVHPCCFAHCMYITQHNRLFQFIVPLIEQNICQINFKTRPLAEIVSGPYFSAVRSESKLNRYCATKCSPFKKQIRKELILHDTYFQNKLTIGAGSTT
ncbi:MAG: radical SAM protein [Thermodesulfobacteriota bacterium]